MKWKHKTLGWTAKTYYYNGLQSSITCTIIKDEEQVNITMPRELIDNDSNWQEIPDGRWLDYSMTAREFMEAFAMVITDGATNHDSYVVKSLIDKNLNKIN